MRLYRSLTLLIATVLAFIAVGFIAGGSAFAAPYPPTTVGSSSIDPTTVTHVNQVGNQLAFTGAPVTTMATFAATLILGGIAILFMGRRRQQAD